MDSSVTIFVFLTLSTISVLARVDIFLIDQQSLCPQQTVDTPRATFTCTSTGGFQWFVNGSTAIFFPANDDDGIRTGGGARAVIISNNGGVRTSVLLFDSFPSANFTIGCNDALQPARSVDFPVAPQQPPSSVVASYIEAGEFLYFNISFSPLGDAQTNFTYRVEIGDEVALTEQPWLFTAIAVDSDNNNNLMVTVTAINECGQESPSSLPVLAERLSTDMPPSTATAEPTTTTETTTTTEEMPTVRRVTLPTWVWIVIAALLLIIVALALGCVVLIVYNIYLKKSIADLEVKQGQELRTCTPSGKEPDN